MHNNQESNRAGAVAVADFSPSPLAASKSGILGSSRTEFATLSATPSLARSRRTKHETPSCVGSNVSSLKSALREMSSNQDMSSDLRTALVLREGSSDSHTLGELSFFRIDITTDNFIDIGVPPSFFEAWRNGNVPSQSVEQLLSAAAADLPDSFFTKSAQEYFVASQLLRDAHTLNLETVPKASDELLDFMLEIKRNGGCADIHKLVLRGCRCLLPTPEHVLNVFFRYFHCSFCAVDVVLPTAARHLSSALKLPLIAWMCVFLCE